MHVDARLFPGEEEQTERTVTDNSGCHRSMLPEALGWAQPSFLHRNRCQSALQPNAHTMTMLQRAYLGWLPVEIVTKPCFRYSAMAGTSLVLE
jgi:hypothetical protein